MSGENPIRFVTVQITQPAHQGEADAQIPVEEACDGVVTVRGSASKAGWTLAEVRVLSRSGWVSISPSDVQLGDIAEMESATAWKIEIPSVSCKRSSECGDGKNTVSAAARFERLDGNAELEEVWESISPPNVQYTANCVSNARPQREKAKSHQHAARGELLSGIRFWHHYTIDLNATGHGTLLCDHHGNPIRARQIQCYASEIEWQRNSKRWHTIRSSTGNGKYLTVAPLTVRHITLPEGCLVVFQEEDFSSGNPAEKHRALVQMVTSEDYRNPNVLELDPGLDIFVHVNALTSLLQPHNGRVGLWVRVIH